MSTAIARASTGAPLVTLRGIVDSYGAQLTSFIEFVQSRGEVEANEDNVREYFVWLKEPGRYKVRTIRAKREAVKSRIRKVYDHAPIAAQVQVAEFFRTLDRLPETKAPKLAKAKTHVGSDKVLSPDEETRLIAASTPRLGWIVKTLLLTGLRISELINIRVGDCARSDSVVTITIRGKGDKERDIRIPEGLYDELRAFYRGEEYLFETQTGGRYDPAYVTHRIKAVSRRTLGRALNAHCMRHSFATNTIRRTGNLKGVSEYLGHSSTSITSDLYDHSILSDADLFVAAV